MDFFTRSLTWHGFLCHLLRRHLDLGSHTRVCLETEAVGGVPCISIWRLKWVLEIVQNSRNLSQIHEI